jgi:rhamnose transport system ATP-binding protein
VSSYLPEVLGLADRVLVMREGLIAGELPAAGATEQQVLHLASPGATPMSRVGAVPAPDGQTSGGHHATE